MPLSRCGTEVAVAHALVPLSHGAAPRPAHWDTSSGLGWKPTVPFSWSIKVKLGLIHSRKTREAAGKAEMERAGVANALRFVRLSHTPARWIRPVGGREHSLLAFSAAVGCHHSAYRLQSISCVADPKGPRRPSRQTQAGNSLLAFNATTSTHPTPIFLLSASYHAACESSRASRLSSASYTTFGCVASEDDGSVPTVDRDGPNSGCRVSRRAAGLLGE